MELRELIERIDVWTDYVKAYINCVPKSICRYVAAGSSDEVEEIKSLIK